MVTLRAVFPQSYITSCSTLPNSNLPPSTNISPGPVACSTKGYTSKPPFSALLYSQPVVCEYSFLHELNNNATATTSIKLEILVILFIFVDFFNKLNDDFLFIL